MRSTVFLILPVLFIIGCASAPLNEAKKQEVNNIGVALLFDDSIPVTSLGTTIFNNKADRVNVANWKLEEIMTDQIASGLKSAGKTYKSVNFDQKKIKELIESGNTGLKRLAGTTDSDLNEYLFSTAQKQGAQYLFTFKPVRSDNYPQPKGFGLFCRAAFGMKGEWQAYNLFQVSLWDLKTKSAIHSAFFSPDEIGYKSGKPCDDIKGSTPEKFVLGFKEQFQTLAKKSAQMTLDKSGLTK